jgi:hypothetical protein
MKRLTAEEFLDKIRSGNAWSLFREFQSGEIKLAIQCNPIFQVTAPVEKLFYLGPDPLETNADAYEKFLFELDKLTNPTLKGLSPRSNE